MFGFGSFFCGEKGGGGVAYEEARRRFSAAGRFLGNDVSPHTVVHVRAKPGLEIKMRGMWLGARILDFLSAVEECTY